MRRTTKSAPAGHIKCILPPTGQGSADYLGTLPVIFGLGKAASRHAVYRVNEGSPLFGKRIRMTGWMKTKDVLDCAGVEMLVLDKDNHECTVDLLYDRPLHGTTDWQLVEKVTDVPKAPCLIYFVTTLYGTGEIWCDDFQIDVVPSDTPITDDRIWHVWSEDPFDYTETTDDSVAHNGHSSLCVSYASPYPPHKYAFIWFGKYFRDPEQVRKYVGHTARLSVWAKFEKISAGSGLDFQPKDGDGKQLANQNTYDNFQGKADWAPYSVTCRIPKGTQNIQMAIYLHGRGKIWIDQDSLKCEILK